MDTSGHRQPPAHHPDSRGEERPAATERHRRDGGDRRASQGGAQPAQHQDEGHEYVRAAIHRTYK